MGLCTLAFPTTWRLSTRQTISAPETGFDSVSEVHVIETANVRTAAAGAFGKGDAHGDWPNMHVTDWDLTNRIGDLWEARVTYKGLFDDKPTKRQVRSYAEKHSGTFIAPGQPTSPMPTEVSEPALGATESYVVTSFPNTSNVAQAGTPQLPPPTPPYIWASLTDPIYRYPNGWVLENRSVDEIAGTNVCFVQDEWLFYHPLKPGGS